MLLLLAALASPAGAQIPAAGPPRQAAPPPATSAPTAPTTSPFLGGIPSGDVSPQPLAISIADAINRSLEHNLGALLAGKLPVARAAPAGWRSANCCPTSTPASAKRGRKSTWPPSVSRPSPAFATSRHRRSVQRVRRARLPVAVGARLRAPRTTRAPKRTTSRPRRYSCRRARAIFVILVAGNLYLQALAASARAEAAARSRQTAAGALQPGGGPEAGRHHRRHRRAARRGAAQHRDSSGPRRRPTSSRKPSCSWRGSSACRLGQSFTLDATAARRCRSPT